MQGKKKLQLLFASTFYVTSEVLQVLAQMPDAVIMVYQIMPYLELYTL